MLKKTWPLQDVVNTYEYDDWNRLEKITTRVNDSVTQTTLYTYDNKGFFTRYLYENLNVILETDERGNERARNLYGLNLLMRDVDSESYCYLYNGHADVTALINTATGEVSATYYYDAFGKI